MGLMDKLSEGAERAAREAEKAFDKGKTKVGELQIEMQMDGLARKLGYLVFDFYRGRQVDQAYRQKILDDMSRLEDQLLRTRAQAAAKAPPEGAGAATAPEASPDTGGAGAAEADGAADSSSGQDTVAGPRSDADASSASGLEATPTGEGPSGGADTTRADSPTTS